MKTRRNTKHKVRRHSHRRAKKGGYGGWNRMTTVGPAWNGQNDGNHFKLSPNGVVVGGVQPAVPEMWGPGMNQTNRLVPALYPNALSMGGGYKRSKRGRSKRGGADFGGFPSIMRVGWDAAKNAVVNGYRGFMGFKPDPNPAPWHQPAFKSHDGPTPQPPKPYAIDALKKMQV